MSSARRVAAMSVDFGRLCRNQAEAHHAAVDAYIVAKTFLAEDRAVWIRCTEEVESITVKQRRFWHGPVLHQISEQAWLTTHDKHGKAVRRDRMVMEWWKEFFRILLLERTPKWEMRRMPRYDRALCKWVSARRATPYRMRQSTEDLGVKKYSAYIDEAIAFAATEFDVQFVFDIDEREAVRYRAPSRKIKEPETCQ